MALLFVLMSFGCTNNKDPEISGNTDVDISGTINQNVITEKGHEANSNASNTTEDVDIQEDLVYATTMTGMELHKENVPEWLALKIDALETKYKEDIRITKIRVIKVEWRNRIVYFIYNSYSSCMLCDLYYADGEKLVFASDEEADDFSKRYTSKKMIYEFGEADFYPHSTNKL